MLKIIFVLFMLFTSSLAGYTCRSPTDCTVHCSNLNQDQVSILKLTNWIAVPWDNGSCYFHNTKTKEDRDDYPLKTIASVE